MKKLLMLLVVISVCCSTTLSAKSKQENLIKNGLFSISLPQNLVGTYNTKVKKDYILIYDKESEKAGFGGFAFGVKAYKNPADHAEMPGGRKIGELRSKNFWNKEGTLYDMVLIQPTDVQYDYTKSPKAPASYLALYNLGNSRNIDITGVKGSTYYKNQGMKGEDLYSDILKKHITAIKEKWDSTKLEKENMSPMYNVIASSGGNTLNKIGYVYYDINGDGIEELLIGEIADKDWKGIIYDMYTMVNRKPQHVVSGWSRNRYFACNSVFVCNEYSSGAMESGVRISILVENSTELFPQVSFKYDGYTNPKQPWFLSYGSDIDENDWENVSEQKFKERKKVFDKYIRFDFIPLSKINK